MERLTSKDVLALALLAILSGAFLSLIVYAGAVLTEQESPLAWAAVSWIVITAWVWFWLVRRYVPGQGDTGTTSHLDVIPDPPRTRVDVWQRYDQYTSGLFLDLPGTRAQLGELGQALVDGAAFSHSSFAGAGKIFTRAQFEILRDTFLKGGLVVWKSPHGHTPGLELTSAGRACARRFAEWAESDTTSPPGNHQVHEHAKQGTSAYTHIPTNNQNSRYEHHDYVD